MPKSEAEIQEQAVMIDRLDSLDTLVRTLAAQQIETDKTMERLMGTIESHLAEESREDAKYDQTMRNLDETLKRIQLELAGQPLIRVREIRAETDRVWVAIRKHEQRFIDIRDKANTEHTTMERRVKEDLRKEAGRHFKGVYVVGTLVCILVGALYYDMRSDIQINNRHIDDHHARHGGSTK